MATLAELFEKTTPSLQPIDVPEWPGAGGIYVRELSVEALTRVRSARGSPEYQAVRLVEAALVDSAGAALLSGDLVNRIISNGSGPFGPTAVRAIADRVIDTLGLELDLDAGAA